MFAVVTVGAQTTVSQPVAVVNSVPLPVQVAAVVPTAAVKVGAHGSATLEPVVNVSPVVINSQTLSSAENLTSYAPSSSTSAKAKVTKTPAASAASESTLAAAAHSAAVVAPEVVHVQGWH